MPDYLVFQLYGPMASWGEIAVGESRHSATYPSKSAVLGLVAAALGIRRHEEEKHQALFESYGFGVKTFSLGTILTDYHTTQVPPERKGTVFRTRKDELAAPKLGTILSSREYRCDALSLAALVPVTNSPPHSLETLAEKLRSPVFVLYLGRKSCPPALPLNPKILVGENLKAALDGYPEINGEFGRIVRGKPYYYWDDLDRVEFGEDASLQTPRYDVCLSRKRRQFGPRTENAFFGKEE